MLIETEIRVKLTNADYFRLLNENDWDNCDNIVDITYGPNGIDSMDINGWIVRIRQKGINTTVEYKSRVKESNSTWHEITVEIDSAEKMAMLLDKLGLKFGLLIKKQRRTKSYGNIMISLDDVEGLGYFIEAEIVSGTIIESGLDLLNKKLLSFGLKDIDKADAYGDLLINKINLNKKFKQQYEAKVKEFLISAKLKV